jgi:uncharacterized lipoprotein
MKNLFTCSLIVLSLIVGGCSQRTTISKFDNKAFLTATSVEPLKVPEELQSTTYVEAYYPAPPGKYPAPGEQPINPIPPNLGEPLEEKDLPVQTPTSNN